jgi:hypothetical protein
MPAFPACGLFFRFLTPTGTKFPMKRMRRRSVRADWAIIPYANMGGRSKDEAAESFLLEFDVQHDSIRAHAASNLVRKVRIQFD